MQRITFSCCRCCSRSTSRSVRRASVHVAKAWWIFLMATFWLVAVSSAELQAL